MYTIFDLNTGEVLRNVITDNITLQLQEGEGFIVSDTNIDDEIFYIDVGGITNKGDYQLDNLPLPCKVIIEGVEYTVTEQPEFTFNVDGVYKISVDAGVQYLKKEFEIDHKS